MATVTLRIDARGATAGAQEFSRGAELIKASALEAAASIERMNTVLTSSRSTQAEASSSAQLSQVLSRLSDVVERLGQARRRNSSTSRDAAASAAAEARAVAAANRQYLAALSSLGGASRATAQMTQFVRRLNEAFKAGIIDQQRFIELMRLGAAQFSVANVSSRDLRNNFRGLNSTVAGLSNSLSVLAFGPLSGIGSRLIATQAAVGELNLALSGVASGAGRAGLIGAFVGVAGAATTTVAGIALGRRLRDSALEFERISNTLRFSTGSIEAAGDAFGFVRDISRDLGAPLAETATQFAKISAAARGTSLEGEATRDIFLGIVEASVALGLTADQTSGALNAIQQIISKGSVQAEELRGQLGERLPGAFQIAARSIGVTTDELNKLLEQGAVASDRFLPAFGDELRRTFGPEAQRNANSLTAEINRLKNAIGTLFRDASQGAFAESLAAGVRDLTAALEGQRLQEIFEGISFALAQFIELARLVPDAAAGIADAFDNIPTTARLIARFVEVQEATDSAREAAEEAQSTIRDLFEEDPGNDNLENRIETLSGLLEGVNEQIEDLQNQPDQLVNIPTGFDFGFNPLAFLPVPDQQVLPPRFNDEIEELQASAQRLRDEISFLESQLEETGTKFEAVRPQFADTNAIVRVLENGIQGLADGNIILGESVLSVTDLIRDENGELSAFTKTVLDLQSKISLAGITDEREKFIQQGINRFVGQATRDNQVVDPGQIGLLEKMLGLLFDLETANDDLEKATRDRLQTEERAADVIQRLVREGNARREAIEQTTVSIETQNQFLREEIELVKARNTEGLRELEIRRQIAEIPEGLLPEERQRRVAAIRENVLLEDTLEQVKRLDEESTKLVDNFRENVQRGIADTLTDAFREGEVSAEAFGDVVLDVLARIAAETVTLAIFAPQAASTQLGGLFGGLGDTLGGFFTQRDQQTTFQKLDTTNQQGFGILTEEAFLQRQISEQQLNEMRNQTGVLASGFDRLLSDLFFASRTGPSGGPARFSFAGLGGGIDLGSVLGAVGGGVGGLLSGAGVLGGTFGLVERLGGGTGTTPFALVAANLGSQLGTAILANTFRTVGASLTIAGAGSLGAAATSVGGALSSAIPLVGQAASIATGIFSILSAENDIDRAAAIVSYLGAGVGGALFGPLGQVVGSFLGGSVYAGAGLEDLRRGGVNATLGGRSPSRVFEETLLTTFDPHSAIVAAILANDASEQRTRFSTRTTAEQSDAARFGQVQTPFGFVSITRRHRLGGGGASGAFLEAVQSIDEAIASFLDEAEIALVAAELQLNEGFVEFNKRVSRRHRGLNRILAERARSTIEALEGEEVAESFLPLKGIQRGNVLENLGETLKSFFEERAAFQGNIRLLSGEQIPEFEQAINRLTGQFNSASERAAQFGFDVSQLAEAFETGRRVLAERALQGLEIENLRARGLDIQADLIEQSIRAEERLANARAIAAELGIEGENAIALAEQTNALELQRILEISIQPLRDFLTQITATTNSPLALGTVLENAEQRFAEILSAVDGGDLSRQGELVDASRSLLDVSREAFGGTEQFFQRFDLVTQSIENVIGQTEALFGSPILEIDTQGIQDLQIEQISVLEAMRTENRLLLEQIDERLAELNASLQASESQSAAQGAAAEAA